MLSHHQLNRLLVCVVLATTFAAWASHHARATPYHGVTTTLPALDVMAREVVDRPVMRWFGHVPDLSVKAHVTVPRHWPPHYLVK